MPRHGQAFWPGAVGCVSCSYTASHGVTPGIATLEIPEQDVSNIRSFGDLVITDTVGTVTLRRCRVTAINFNPATSGRTILLHIADRRWQWKHGFVSGNWNVIDPYPDPDIFPPGEFIAFGGPFAPGTFRPAHLLMADCLREMHEVNPLIDPAPAVAVPQRWEEEPPAYALQQVAESLGFRVCFQPTLDRVLVAPLGVGASLPDDLPFVSNAPSLALPQRPATILLAGGAILFNDFLALEPVGTEPTGEVRPLDKLSYTPRFGWMHSNPMVFEDVSPTTQLTRAEAIDLAKRCVWRMFRVKMIDVATGRAPGPVVPRYGTVNDRKQIVLQPQRYGVFKRANGQPDTTAPFVTGSIYLPNVGGIIGAGANPVGQNTNAADGIRLPRTPQIDTARGLVTFDRQCYRKTEIAGRSHIEPPELYLNTGFQIRATVGQILTKFYYGGTLPGLIDMNCPPEILRHPELVPIINVVRKDATRAVATVSDNLDELFPAADYYVNAANAKYEIGAATDRTYAGIIPIDPDGAIAQVTWSVGGGSPATTRVSRNSEHSMYLPNYPERRRTEQIIAFNGRKVAEELVNVAPGPRAPGRTPLPPGSMDYIPPGS